MLSSSHPKIHEPRVTGVSPRPTDQRQRQKLRNTGRHQEDAIFAPARQLDPLLVIQGTRNHRYDCPDLATLH